MVVDSRYWRHEIVAGRDEDDPGQGMVAGRSVPHKRTDADSYCRTNGEDPDVHPHEGLRYKDMQLVDMLYFEGRVRYSMAAVLLAKHGGIHCRTHAGGETL